MKRSQAVLEWMREGRLEGREEGKRELLLVLLRERFGQEVPPDLMVRIEAMTDARQIAHWVAVAYASPTLAAFRAALERNGG